MIKSGTAIGQALTNASYLEDRRLKKALRGFESMFVLQLLKSMRSASLDKKQSGLGMDTFLSITDQALADYIGEKERFGIAKTLYKYFKTQAAATQRPETIASRPEPISLGGERPGQERQELKTLKKTEDVMMKLKKAQAEPQHKIQPPMHEDNSARGPKAESGATARGSESSAVEETLRQKSDQAVQQTNPIDTALERASKEYALPRDLLEAMIRTESGGDSGAVSQKGAKGLMQLIDTTAADMGVTDSFDPEQNIMGGAKYIRQLLDHFQGDLKLALAAYNAGPANVQKFGGIPPFRETKNYVTKIMNILNEGNFGKDPKVLADKTNEEAEWNIYTKR